MCECLLMILGRFERTHGDSGVVRTRRIGEGDLRTFVQLDRISSQRRYFGADGRGQTRQKYRHRCFGYLRVRNIPNEYFRATVHQLLQRKTPATVHRIGSEARAGRIRTGRNRLETCELRRRRGNHFTTSELRKSVKYGRGNRFITQAFWLQVQFCSNLR